jgi:hypothetical protein
MIGRTTNIILLIGFLSLFCGCSTKVTQPVDIDWQAVPCEYRLEGDDESILLVRAQIAEFDLAKIIVHTFCWTVLGDTLLTEIALYPREHRKTDYYTIFTSDRCLPINSILRSVELFIKN